MTKVTEPMLSVVRNLFGRYEQELLASNYSPPSTTKRIDHARHFVQWLADEYSPGDYKGTTT